MARPSRIGLGMAREAARRYLECPEYHKAMMDRIKAGTLPPAVEVLLWHYAFGKPVDHIKLTDMSAEKQNIRDVTPTQLQDRLRMLSQALAEAADREEKKALAGAMVVEAEHIQ